MPLIKVAYFMLNFLNLKSFLSHLFFWVASCLSTLWKACARIYRSYRYTSTGGPPLTRFPLTQFPLTRFLAYVRVSGGISVSRGPQYSPTNTNFM